MKRWHPLTFACLLVGLAGAAVAAPNHESAHLQDHAGPRGPAIREPPRDASGFSLNPTKEQATRMQDIKDRYQTGIRDLRSQLFMKRIEMRRLCSDPTMDQSALMAKEKELNVLRQRFSEKRTQMRMEWRSILTPEQIQKLDAMTMGREPARDRGKGGR